MSPEFIIRSYGFGELAQLYFPDISQNSAGNNLRKWIRESEQLMEELYKNCYKKGQRILTPKQVEIIIKYLGLP